MKDFCSRYVTLVSGKIAACHVVGRVARRATGLEASLSLQKCSCKYILSYNRDIMMKMQERLKARSTLLRFLNLYECHVLSERESN